MSFMQTREILKCTRRDHLRVANELMDLEDLFTQERTSSLCRFAEGQQRHMAEYIRHYLESMPKDVLMSWFQNTPDKCDIHAILEDISVDMRDREFEAVIHDISKKFEDRYEMYEKIAELPKTKDMFLRLAQVSRHTAEQFQWRSTENHDI